MEWLEVNTRSPEAFRDALEGEVSAQVQRAVGALLDQVWKAVELDEGDRKRLKELASSLRGLLDDAAGWDERLKGEALKLKGSLGFSLSLEMERLARDTALVDLELDPRDRACRKAFSKHLGRGRVTKFLGRLAEIDPANENPTLGPSLPYMLRDCALTSKRVRSSSLSAFFSLIGVRTDRTQRLYEASVRFLQEPDGRRWREGRYTGALIRTRVESKMTAAAAVWLELTGTGTGHGPGDPYDTSFDAWLRLTYTRDDDFLTADEVHGLSTLLQDLGFVSPGDSFPTQQPVQVGLEYRVPAPQNAVAALLTGLDGATGETRWNQDLLNAAHRWFDERLADVRDPALTGKYPNGEQPLARHILPKFIQSRGFRDEWTRGILVFEQWAHGKVFTIRDGGVDFRFRLMPGGDWKAPYLCLNSLVTKRGLGLKQVRALARSHQKLVAAPDHSSSLEFAQAFGTAFKAASPVFWPSPMSAVWLVLARLAQMDATVFNEAQGVATWRWVENGTPAGPLVWRLEKGAGLADPRVRREVFPVPRVG